MQHGSIYKKDGAWHLRYRVNEIGTDGQRRRREITKRLAAIDDDHRSKSDVKDIAEDLLAKEHRGGLAEGSLHFADFVDRYFLPFVKQRKKASTYKFYKDTIDNHVHPALGELRLREVQTVHVQRGLCWEDYSGQELFVRRAVWRKKVGDVKTPESKSRVPVVAPLAKLLDAHRKRDGKFKWVFSGPRGFAIDTHNLVARSTPNDP